MPAKDNVLEVLPPEHIAYIKNMQTEIYLFSCEMRAFADPCEGWGVNVMPLATQDLGGARPYPRAMPSTVHKYECRHFLLPIRRVPSIDA